MNRTPSSRRPPPVYETSVFVLCYCVLLCVLCVVWSPSSNADLFLCLSASAAGISGSPKLTMGQVQSAEESTPCSRRRQGCRAGFVNGSNGLRAGFRVPDRSVCFCCSCVTLPVQACAAYRYHSRSSNTAIYSV